MSRHAPLLASLLLAACSSAPASSPDAGTADAGPEPVPACEADGVPQRAFVAEAHGTHRGETVGDLSLPLHDGSSWTLSAQWTGCDSYVFVPDTLPKSQRDTASIWTSATDLRQLLRLSPRAVHYFFVSRQADAAKAQASLDAMAPRIETALSGLPQEDQDFWRPRVHLVATRAAELGGWVGDVLKGVGALGFAIDRQQALRGLGSLADVSRVDSQLQQAGQWPFIQNLSFVAHEARYLHAQAQTRAALAADGATVVDLWKGEVLEGFAETDAQLPSPEKMAGFDTLQVEVTQACPDPEKVEFGNCGAWDYLAWLTVKDDAGKSVELARFITAYHRETHWVVDASALLPVLKAGGTRHFRWEFAPEWNKQPTATHLSLRFSHQGKDAAPREVVPLWNHRDKAFDASFNDDRPPLEVAIPADAKKVELVVLVTGHGAEDAQCAEFCNHQHEFTINGAAVRKEFPMAGSKTGCVDQVEHGMTPNQAGTWWYGRGGWCPGQQVDPWVVDVTEHVTPGQTATVSYRGLFRNATPAANAGKMNLTSSLVISR